VLIDPLFLSLSTVVSVTAMAMGAYVFFRNPHLGISRAFLAVMLLLSATSALDYLFLTAPTYDQAMLMLRLLEFFLVCLFGGFLYLTTFFALESDCAVFARNLPRYAALVVLSGVVSALFFAKASRGDQGWFVPNSPEMLGTGALMLIYLGYSLHVLNSADRVSRDPGHGNRVAGLTLAMALPFAYPLLVSVLELLGISFPTPLAPAYLITSVTFFHSILRERLFDMVPSDDFSRVVLRGQPIKLEPGRSYAVQEKGTETSFRIFASELNAGRKGLIISRRHPDQIREEYGLRNTPMIWLAHRPIKDAVSPSNLALLERTVMRFMSEGGNTVVLVEGLDQMILETSSEKAMRFLFNLTDEALVRGSRLILSFDPDGLSARDRALLMRDMVVLDREGSAVVRPPFLGPDLPGPVAISLSSRRWA
jgi:hypothetical protein